jgi:EmrB/QacA subfamily drug resistance transporter
MTPKQTIQAISGLLVGMFVAILSGTVVATSLPVIISDLGGTQADYTWVITASLLATTVSTPLWGKLADIVSRKLLLQLALVVFVIGTAIAGLAQDTGFLIAFRVVQGLGVGGLMALGQVVIADIISPRERGRYMGLMGAIMAVGQIGGPLLGGVITDSAGWRWNFYVAIPFAILAIVLLQRTLHLPVIRRKVSIDYLGGALIVTGVSSLLIWVSLGGHQFAWDSPTSLVLGIGTALVLVAAVIVELRSKEPLIPLRLFRERTFALAVIASVSVGVVMFGTSVFLSQYLQLARGKTPTESGVFTIPMVIGTLGASIVIGALISKLGRWKAFVITGASLLIVGLVMMSRIHFDTSMWFVGAAMFVLGNGVGMLMQNLVLVVQNTLPATKLGSGSAAVTFFRSLGGTIGVTVLGSVLATDVVGRIEDGLRAIGVDPGALGGGGGAVPNLSELPDPIRLVVEASYGESVAMLFLLCVPLAVVTLIAVIFLPNRALSHKTAVQQLEEELGAEFAPLQPEPR